MASDIIIPGADRAEDCVFMMEEHPVLQCEWQPPEDIPGGSPPVEYPPGVPEEEPFVPETEPPKPPEEIPREKATMNYDNLSQFSPAWNNNKWRIFAYVRG